MGKLTQAEGRIVVYSFVCPCVHPVNIFKDSHNYLSKPLKLPCAAFVLGKA